MRRTSAWIVIGCALVGVSGCGGDAVDGRETRVVEGKRVFVAETSDCDDADACAETYAIDGVLYGVVEICVPERPVSTGLLVAVIDGTRVKRFYAVDDGGVVAEVRAPGAGCAWQLLRRVGSTK